MDRATRKRLYNLCDPAEPVGPDDARWVDVDAFGVRGEPFIDPLATAIEMSVRPRLERLSASAGSGVTSELLRVKTLLARDHNRLVVFVDAAELLDLRSPIAASDVLLAIVQCTHEVVTQAEGRTAADPLGRIWSWLKDGHRDLAALLGPPQSPVAVLRDNPMLRATLRLHVEAARSDFLRRIREELSLCESRARYLGRAGITVLVDGLETLQGMQSEWRDVLRSAERVFVAGHEELELPVHTIYTVPLSLGWRLERSVHVMPAIALFDRAGRRSEAGFEAARAIVHRRVAEPELDALFGPDRRIELTDKLIRATGGVAREIVGMVQSCIAEPSFDDRCLSRIAAAPREKYRSAIPESAYPWLARIHQTKALPIVDGSDAELLERMLAIGAVLPYWQDSLYYDLHPAMQAVLDAGSRLAWM